MHDGIPYDLIQGHSQGHESFKLEILQFSKCISSAIFNVSWQMTTDSETTEQYLTFVQSRFLVVFVSRDFKLGRVSVQFVNAFAIAITFARWRRRLESTAVTYRTNFLIKHYTGIILLIFSIIYSVCFIQVLGRKLLRF